MIIIRRRFIFWLIRAYVRKLGKVILLYFAIGLFIFLIGRLSYGFILTGLEPYLYQKQTIGMVGSYTTDSLALPILHNISRGLTFVDKDGLAKPDIAEKWRVGNNGKTYTFYLKRNLHFSNNTNLTSHLISYSFTDVSVKKPDKYTIVFSLKDNYSPFLVAASKPILIKGFIGVGNYKVKNIKLNGNFVESLTLVSKNKHKTIVYQFYPTENALKTAFALGEVSKISGLKDANFKDITFYSFKNAKVEKNVNFKQLVTLFYNTQDKILSSKTLREALSYTIPDDLSEGQRNSGPYPPFSFANDERFSNIRQDFDHVRLLLEKVRQGTDSASISLTIDTLPQYKSVAEKIAKIWNDLDIKTNVKVVGKIPSSFQIFLGDFNVPADPDQYVLWHSNQEDNITHYSNLRVDKILEDGRKEVDTKERKKIYADFQKFILADPPASFLFFPYTFDVTRK